jgi:hypothetical protein
MNLINTLYLDSNMNELEVQSKPSCKCADAILALWHCGTVAQVCKAHPTAGWSVSFKIFRGSDMYCNLFHAASFEGLPACHLKGFG